MQIINISELVHNGLNFFAVVNTEFDGTVEDAVVATNSYLVDIDTQLVANHLTYIQQHALTVDTLDFDGSIEEYLLVHVPFGIYDAVAETGLQFGCYAARALMDLDAVLVADKAHNVIAMNRMAAAREDKLVDVLLGQDEWLLLVEVFAHHEKILRLHDAFFLSLLLALAQEWDIIAPAAGLLFFRLALQLIEIFIA